MHYRCTKRYILLCYQNACAVTLTNLKGPALLGQRESIHFNVIFVVFWGLNNFYFLSTKLKQDVKIFVFHEPWSIINSFGVGNPRWIEITILNFPIGYQNLLSNSAGGAELNSARVGRKLLPLLIVGISFI